MTCFEKFCIDHFVKNPTESYKMNVIIRKCPSRYGYLPDSGYCGEWDSCKRCWDREIPEDKEENMESKILDSGDRTEFESGAVRDMREGKGRCDLLPLDVVSKFFVYLSGEDVVIKALDSISKFQEHGEVPYLYRALEWCGLYDGYFDMLLEVAIHFEEGAKKYGDNNWRKGIPVHCYIDSAVRHYLKYLRGDKDEPHDRAFCWNIMCAIWTCDHHPELNVYANDNILRDIHTGMTIRSEIKQTELNKEVTDMMG